MGGSGWGPNFVASPQANAPHPTQPRGPSTIRALLPRSPNFWPYCPYSCSFCPSQQASRSYKLFRPHTASISLCSITHLSRLVSLSLLLPALHTHSSCSSLHSIDYLHPSAFISCFTLRPLDLRTFLNVPTFTQDHHKTDKTLFIPTDIIS